MSKLIELVKSGASIEDIKADIIANICAGRNNVNYIDFQDCTGMTALMYASLKGDVNVVQMLLDAGADAFVESYVTGGTAMHYSNHVEVATLLANYRKPLQKEYTTKLTTFKSNPTTEFISIAQRVIGDYYSRLPTEATEENCEAIKWLTLDVFKELFLKELKKDTTTGIYVDFIPKWVNFISHDLDISALKTLLMLGEVEYICSPNESVTIGGATIYLFGFIIVPRDICVKTNEIVLSANSIIYNKVKEEFLEECAKRFANNANKHIYLDRYGVIKHHGYIYSKDEVIIGVTKIAKERYNVTLNKIEDGCYTILINPNYVEPTKGAFNESNSTQSATKKGFFSFLKGK